MLPMHVAAMNGVDVETFNLMLQEYPEACKMVDSTNCIPLECALRVNDGLDFEVIEALVGVSPDALKQSPLMFHRICELWHVTESFVSSVQATFPEVFLYADAGGCVPLHRVMVGLSRESAAKICF